MTPGTRLLAPLLLLLALATGGPARADLFSPGELARAHQALEGLQNCTKCHVAGEQLAPETCLACHGEVKSRIAQGKGLHGKLPAGERACEKCHHEHQGRDFALVDWGKAGKKGFDHARTGFELKGKHRRADCEKCHDRRLVKDAGVLEVLGKHADKQGYLGAPAACASCHVDEHRGQLGEDCQRCHGEDSWKPAKGFQHARTRYRLEGRHARVECAKCHKQEQEPEARKGAPGQVGPVNAAAFARYKGLQFGECSECHKDPHQGRLGERCQGCHSPADWKKLSGAAAERAFHDKTRYPLKGAHAEVKCASCHGPFPGQKAVFKGLAFGRCTDCHLDAHLGQLAVAAATPSPAPTGKKKKAPPAAPVVAGPDCERCHTLEAWVPVRFEVTDHAKLDYRLEGAHRAAACAGCHPKDPRLERRVTAAQRKDRERRKRPVQVSLAVLDLPKAADCRSCHRDPHGGQFDARMAAKGSEPQAGGEAPTSSARRGGGAAPGDAGCQACHGLDSFRKARFDHAKDSRYPLEGKHAQAACGSCHREGPDGRVKYKPLPLACAGCHADAHAGQFASKGQGTDCARCHAAAGWKELKFRHAEPYTRFALDGRHEKVACEKCHGVVRVAGAEVRRYKPLAVACQACHDDFHRGAFRGFAPTAATAPSKGKAGAPDLAVRPAKGEAAPGETACGACHSTAGWTAQGFDHARTGFPLEGAHRQAACAGCHTDRTFKAPVPRACAACHKDVHLARLGGRCEKCHEPASWASTTFDADAHRRSNFPLSGKHAFTACDACHANRRDLGFGRPTRECLGCHEDDLLRAQSGAAYVDHGVPNFPQECQSCHSTWGFAPASLAGHEACFDIKGGPHAGIACKNCHSSPPPGDVTQQPFQCLSDTANCMQCHSCSDHEPVSGGPPTSCVNRKCYECHRFSGGGDLRSPGRRLPASQQLRGGVR